MGPQVLVGEVIEQMVALDTIDPATGSDNIVDRRGGPLDDTARLGMYHVGTSKV